MYIQVKGKRITLLTEGKSQSRRYPDSVAWPIKEAPADCKEVAIFSGGQGYYYASFVSEKKEEIKDYVSDNFDC